MSVKFEGLGSAMLVVIDAVGTAVEALGSVGEASELVVEVLCLSITNQVFRVSKRPWDRILRRQTFSGGLAG